MQPSYFILHPSPITFILHFATSFKLFILFYLANDLSQKETMKLKVDEAAVLVVTSKQAYMAYESRLNIIALLLFNDLNFYLQSIVYSL